MKLQTCEYRGRWRLTLGLSLGLSLGLVAAPMSAWATPVLAQAEEISTEIKVSQPVIADRTIYILGKNLPVSATVSPSLTGAQETTGAPEGTVEFYADNIFLGDAELVASAKAGQSTATIETSRWPAGGAYDVTAIYAPADGSGYVGSHSTAVTYRIADTSRVVPDIELTDDTAAEIHNASLEWSIANIWFSNFTVGFEREVISGSVSLPEMTPGSTIAERQQYYWRPFTFSEGTGTTDVQGNRIINFPGTARLSSGNGNQWDFTDPQVHISSAGEGYITAVFEGFYKVGNQQNYGPTRVTIATFNEAIFDTSDEGVTHATIELIYEGQANGTGTWAMDYNDSFPNEFVALLNPGVSLFFTKSSVSTDESKIPHPITLSFSESEVSTPQPMPDADDTDAPAEPTQEPTADPTHPQSDESEAPGKTTTHQPTVEPSATSGVRTSSHPSGGDATAKTPESTTTKDGSLAATGAIGTVIAICVGLWLTIAGGVLVLSRRRASKRSI